MFLRWHYLIDVFAGLALAGIGMLLGQRIADWERAKRARLGLQAAWMPLVYPSFGVRPTSEPRPLGLSERTCWDSRSSARATTCPGRR